MPTHLTLTYNNKEYLFTGKKDFRIGRDGDNDLIIGNEDEYYFVSNRHVGISLSNGTFFCEDLKSTNGTTLQNEAGQQRLIPNAPVELKDKGFLLLGKDESVVAVYYSIIESHRTISDGKQLIKDGKIKEASDLFQRIIREDRYNSSAHYWAGVAAARENDIQRAIESYNNCIMLRHDTPPLGVLIDIGKLYEKDGQLGRARESYHSVIEVQNNSARTKKLKKEAQDRLDSLFRFQPGVGRGGQKVTSEIMGAERPGETAVAPFFIDFNVSAHGRITVDVLKALQDGFDSIGDVLGELPQGRISVTMKRPTQSISGLTGRKGITLFIELKSLSERVFLDVIVKHEYAHYALGSFTGFSRKVPWWLHEGFAQHLSQNLVFPRLMDMQGIITAGQRIPLEKLVDPPSGRGDQESLDTEYLHAHAAVAFLMKAFSREDLRTFAKTTGAGGGLGKAFKKIGTTMAEFEVNWVAWVRSSAAAGETRLTREIRCSK